MKIIYSIIIAISLLLTLSDSLLAQDCNNDTTLPVPICLTGLTVPLTTGSVTVPAAAVNAGSYDLCGDVDLRISPSGTVTEPPMETEITFTTFGDYAVDLWVIDESGNWDYCITNIIIPDFADPCINDVNPPIAVCDQDLTVSLNEPNGDYLLFAEAVDEGSWDNCGDVDLRIDLQNTLDVPPAENNVLITAPGQYIATLWAIDGAGNFNKCWTEITVLDSGTNCQGDDIAPVPYCLNGLTAALSGFDNSVTIWAIDILIDVTDNCSELFTYGIEMGNAGSQPPTTQSLNFTTPGTYLVAVWTGDEAGNWNYCETNVVINPNLSPVKRFSGVVFLDDDASCSFNAGEGLLEGWTVEAIPYINGQLDFSNQFTTQTIADGTYQLDIPETLIDNATSFELRLSLAFNLTQNCPTVFTIPATGFDGISEIAQDFSVKLEEDCYALQVDIASPFLRRCFDSYYIINYCNYGSEVAEDAYVEVLLDDYLSYTGSTIFPDVINGNVYSFPLGDIGPGECSSFKLNVNVSCDALFGQTHCTEAHVYPDVPCDDNYTGAVIQVEGNCNESNNEVEFVIRNVGEQDMISMKNYFVVEDVIMYMENPYNLDSGDSITVLLPGNGATYRLEAEQPDTYPWLGITGATIEGCGVDEQGNTSTGIITQFSNLEPGDFISIDCQQNVGSYDPNDKQASPQGVGEEHLIRENTSLDYKIRFQNTGTDTAFTVVILDTLSSWLEPTSVRPGASSHPYTFQLLEDHILEFRFDNIMLPDSNINLEASNGFVQFEVEQLPDNPRNTLIENSAAIYFDFNEPVITNTVFHTIGELFISVQTSEVSSDASALRIFPNPASESVNIQMTDAEGGQIQLFDASGRLYVEQAFRGNEFNLLLNGLNTGMYFYQVISNSGQWHRGSISIVK